MKNYSVLGVIWCLFPVNALASDMMCSMMKALFYPLEHLNMHNVRGKVNEVLKQGKLEDLGDRCFIRTKQETGDIRLCVAGMTDHTTKTMIAANIILDYPVTIAAKKIRWVSIVGTTHSKRNADDCSYQGENRTLLTKIALYFNNTSNNRITFDCGRVETNADFSAAGFKESSGYGLGAYQYALLQALFNKPTISYCNDVHCWQSNCTQH